MSDTQDVLNYKSCFDIIGPIMIGPSSSHTAGALAMGTAARKLLQWEPTYARIVYYESFAETHKGHGTDFAVVAGLLGFATDDLRVPQAVEIAREKGIVIEFIESREDSPCQHANTADITLTDGHNTVNVLGISVGGGMIEVKRFSIAGFEVVPGGPLPMLIYLTERDTDDLVTAFLETWGVGVRTLHHQQEGQRQLFVYELQTIVPQAVQEQLFELGVQVTEKIILL